MSESTPGWHPDPQGRHQHRFWDGTAWTDQVSDDGTVSTDPLVTATPPAQEQPGQASDATVIGSPTPLPDTPPAAPSPPGFGGIPASGAAGAAEAAPGPGPDPGPPPSVGPPPAGSADPFGGIPPVGGAATPGPPAGGAPPPPGSAPPPPYGSTPPPPSSRSKLPLLIVAVVVAIVVIGVGLLALSGSGGASGAGDFTVKVSEDKPVVHKVELEAGEGVYVSVDGKHLHRALAVDQSTYERAKAAKFVTAKGTTAADVKAFYKDTNLIDAYDSLNTDSAANDYPGVAGKTVFLPFTFYGNSPYTGKTERLAAPVSGTYYVVVLSDNGDQQAKISIRTKKNPKVTKDLNTDDYSQLDTGFYTDFFTEASDDVKSHS